MHPRCTGIEFKAIIQPVPHLPFQTIDFGAGRIDDLRSCRTEQRYLQVLVIIIERRCFDAQHAIIKFVTDFESINRFWLYRIAC